MVEGELLHHGLSMLCNQQQADLELRGSTTVLLEDILNAYICCLFFPALVFIDKYDQSGSSSDTQTTSSRDLTGYQCTKTEVAVDLGIYSE